MLDSPLDHFWWYLMVFHKFSKNKPNPYIHVIITCWTPHWTTFDGILWYLYEYFFHFSPCYQTSMYIVSFSLHDSYSSIRITHSFLCALWWPSWVFETKLHKHISLDISCCMVNIFFSFSHDFCVYMSNIASSRYLPNTYAIGLHCSWCLEGCIGAHWCHYTMVWLDHKQQHTI